MGSDLEMKPCIFVHVRGLEHTVYSLFGWQRNRAHCLRICCSCSIHYLLA
ncbi:hypothetical protein HanRHA438_Chr13g0605201 [Helianthus annuus]|nr:hypothetical protein HanRHA438_Chr13g0605201 [Helianthus annuus]